MADFIVSDSGAPYTSIAAAYEAAAAEARSTGVVQNVIVAFGEYNESFTMDTDGVNIVSSEADNSIQPFINGTLTVSFSSTAYVSAQKTATILSFKIKSIQFVGSEYQNLVLANSEIVNSTGPAININNSGLSGSSSGYQPSTLNANTTILSTLHGASPAVNVESGYFVASQMNINAASTSSVAVLVKSLRVSPSTAQTGANINEAQILGQVKMEYVSTPIYTTLILNRSKITTDGPTAYPFYAQNGRAKLTYVVLANPLSEYAIYSTPTSVVAYQNLSVPANSSSGPTPDIPRFQIAPDLAGGVVLNDQKGRLATLVGTQTGQMLRWNQTKNSWEANNSTVAVNFERNGVAFGAAGTLNFQSSMAVAGSVTSDVATIELQLASSPTLVTSTPYSLDLSYRAFYVDSLTDTVINLPTASELSQQFVFFKNLTGNKVTVTASTGELVDGQASVELENQYDGLLLQSVSFDGIAWNWYKVTVGSTSSNVPTKFNLTMSEPVTVGDLVAVLPDGTGVLADSTIVGHYPAVGVCVALKDSVASVQPVGPASVFTGLNSGSIYFLGESGKLSSTMPSSAIVAHTVAMAISSTEALITTSNIPIYR